MIQVVHKFLQSGYPNFGRNVSVDRLENGFHNLTLFTESGGNASCVVFYFPKITG